jgi:hypothetical protein
MCSCIETEPVGGHSLTMFCGLLFAVGGLADELQSILGSGYHKHIAFTGLSSTWLWL